MVTNNILSIYHAELDALEADMGMETESDGVPAYLQPDKEPNLEEELNLPPAPTGHAPVPPGRAQVNWAEEKPGNYCFPPSFPFISG